MHDPHLHGLTAQLHKPKQPIITTSGCSYSHAPQPRPQHGPIHYDQMCTQKLPQQSVSCTMHTQCTCTLAQKTGAAAAGHCCVSSILIAQMLTGWCHRWIWQLIDSGQVQLHCDCPGRPTAAEHHQDLDWQLELAVARGWGNCTSTAAATATAQPMPDQQPGKA